MINKNSKKAIFKELAGKGQCKYVRLTDSSVSFGNFVVTVRAEGYEAFRKEGDRYIPVSFHCTHGSGYAHEIWEGITYQILRREANKNEDEYILWQVLWNQPHLGHYEFDPDEI